MMELLIPFSMAFICALIFIRFGKPIAIKTGLVDKPNERKKHIGAIPLVGGVSIFFSVLFTSIIFIAPNQSLNLYLLAAALIVFIGVLDDFYDLPVKPRIAAQVLVAGIMVFGANLYLKNLGDLLNLGNIYLNYIGIVFTVVAVVGAINAFNMVDGIDGLAGMLSIVTFSALTLLLNRIDTSWLVLPLLFIGATCAYLIFNLQWPSAKIKKIFMGDAGSMLIGFTVVWLLVVGTQSEQQAFKPVTALWLIAIPLMDMAAIMIRRIKKGQSPFKPDRDHLHHIFLRAGFSSKQTLFIISALAFLFCGFGILLEYKETPEWLIFSLFIFMFTLYFYAINYVWRLLKFFRRVTLK